MYIDEMELRVKSYVEMEAETTVKSIEYIKSYSVFGSQDLVFLVDTLDGKWWVIGGSTPMNLYSVDKFDSEDEAFSFHVGIITRLAERNSYLEEDNEDVGYDAFISHASEDKESFVRPLYNLLKIAGLKIWYDENSMEVGDSLRKSIDKGLANSRYGIVIFSMNFFTKAKKWPDYELNGLLSKEIDGEKVILPIWYNVSKEEILKYSPSLADKIALNANILSIDEIAYKLIHVILKD